MRVQLDRWERAGLVLRQRLYGRSWVVPTSAGLAFAGLPYTPWRPSYGRLAHVHAVSVVRLALEAAAPGLAWISERALERERRQAGGTWHRADAAIEVPAPADRPRLQQALHAIEAELTPKSRPNLAEVFDTLAGNTVAVTYFAPPATWPPCGWRWPRSRPTTGPAWRCGARAAPGARYQLRGGAVSAQLPGPGRAPSPPPRVVTVLGLYTLLGLVCLPALPASIATAALLRARPRLRPWLVAGVGAAALAGVLATAQSPLFRGNLLSFHLSGWAMFSITHPHVDVAFWRMVFEAPVGLPVGVLLGVAHMIHSDHATRSLPWHPRTIQRTATANARAGRQVARTLQRMPPFVGDAPRSGRSTTGSCPPGSTAPMPCCRGSCAAGRSPWPAPLGSARRSCSGAWSAPTPPVVGGWCSSTPRLPSPPGRRADRRLHRRGRIRPPGQALASRAPVGLAGRPDGAGQPPVGRPGLVGALV